MKQPYTRAGRLVAGLLVLDALLVMLHLGHFGTPWPPARPELDRKHELGEFWPFSIYPMFSRGAHPWVRSLVREVPGPDAPNLWAPRSIDDLPGTPYALGDVGIVQNDISNFISKTRTWSDRRIAGFRRVFGDELENKHLLIMRADGSITGDSVSVVFTPFLLMAPDTTYFNPNLDYGTE